MLERTCAKRLLVVDDDGGLLRLINRQLTRLGFIVTTAASAAEARNVLATAQPDLALLDLHLQDLSGHALIKSLTACAGFPPFIIITGQGDERVAVEMMKAGALDYVIKDQDFHKVLPTAVKRGLSQVERDRKLVAAESRVHLVQSAVEQGFSGVLIADASLPDPNVLYINPAFAKATGCQSEDILGRPLSQFSQLDSLRSRIGRGLPAGELFMEGTSTVGNPADQRLVEWRFSPVKDKTGAIGNWLVIFRDVTERTRLEREILEISDRERQRIGQDLHDGICQHLAGIELMSRVLQQNLAKHSKVDAAQAGEIAKFVREAIGHTRSLARGLSPVTLEAEGLECALRELAANTEKMFGVECRIRVSGIPAKCESVAGIQFYRIAQEAVANALKHGKASAIRIELAAALDRITLAITDNGTGLAVPESNNGMGLRIMRYRAGILGGTLHMEPAKPNGTRVVCSCGPLACQSGTAA